MRLFELLRETFRDMVSGMSKMVLLFVGIMALTICLIGFDLLQIIAIERQVEQFHDVKADVAMIVHAKSVNGESCDNVARSQSVEASGALRTGGSIALVALPYNQIPIFEVTGGMMDVVAVADDDVGGGVWIPEQVAGKLGLNAGSEVATDHGSMRVAAVYAWPEDGRDSRFGYAVIVPVPASGTFDECWAQTRMSKDSATSLLRYTLFHDAETGGSQVGQLNYAKGDWVDGYGLFSGRLSRFVIPTAGVFAAVLAYVCVRSRKLELAGNLHAGGGKIAQLLQLVLEQFVPAIMGLVVTLTGMAVAISAFGVPDATGLIELAMYEVGWIPVGVVVGTLVGGMTIRERDLFRHFKNRV